MINLNAIRESLSGFSSFIIRKTKREIGGQLPCKVISVNESRTIVTVKPLIKKVMTDGTIEPRPEISGVPIFTLGAGGALLTFNVSVGDKGWIKASARDISAFLGTYADSAPPTRRMHSLSDAVFYPDAMAGFTINDNDTAAAALQNTDGTTRISVADGQIYIAVGDSEISVSSNLIKLTADTINLNGATIDSGGIITDGNGIVSNTHTHNVDNVQAGSSTIESDKPQ